MGIATKGLFRRIWQSQLQFVRCKTKVSVTRPRAPFFERALMETVCLPIFEKAQKLQYVPNYDSCVKKVKREKVEEDHPFKTILINEAQDWFKQSKMIALFHLNAINGEEKFQCKLLMKKGGMKFMLLNKKILCEALSGTAYEALLKFYDAPTATVFSPDVNIHELLKITKKLPKLALMGGVINNRLLSLSELQAYGKFENITQAQSMLLQTLNSVSQNIVQQISHHPSNFVGLLNQHKKILKGE